MDFLFTLCLLETVWMCHAPSAYTAAVEDWRSFWCVPFVARASTGSVLDSPAVTWATTPTPLYAVPALLAVCVAFPTRWVEL